MLSTLEKLLETIVKDQLVEYMEKNNLLTKWQSGYRRRHSCETALNLVVSNWKKLLDKRLSVIAVFLDMKRAFETIDRKRLLEKLRAFGFDSNSVKWFENYLDNRRQCTVVNNSTSSEIVNDLGVPQGSVIGAYLFILYINDMPECLMNATVNLFADDTLLYVYGNDMEEMSERMSRDLKRIEDWLKANKLKVNEQKTKVMQLQSGRTSDVVNLTMNGVALETVNSIKYLGILIDNKVNLKENIQLVCKKVARKIGLFSRISRNLTYKARVSVYKSIIAPHFDYCASLLLTANKSEMERMQKLQNKAMRIILRCRRDTSIKSMLETLEIMSVNQRIWFQTLKLVHKIKNEMVPEYLAEMTKTNGEIHGRNLRNRNDFRLPTVNKKTTRNMMLYIGLKQFNELPMEIKSEKIMKRFELKLSEFVINKIKIK